jgi:ubiquinone/menaquinone biosynthesis C-methylase UbiE
VESALVNELEPPFSQTPAKVHWSISADAWIAWARSPHLDTYWYWRDAFFGDIVPVPGRLTLEVGCGEGRVTRDLLAHGHRVIALDIVDRLVYASRALAESPRYLVADAAHLPFPSESFDVAVAHNSLMDVDELDVAVAELSRVLQKGGHLCVSVVHPMFDAGTFERGTGRFVVGHSYHRRRPFIGVYRRDDLEMAFRGWAYSMEHYFRALEQANLVVERLREPLPAAAPAPLGSGQRFDIVPPFLHIRARRIAD